MDYLSIKGLEKKISKLAIGNDNQPDYDSAAPIWDHWLETGANAFDNSYVYKDGLSEKVLGEWIKKRNNADDLVIIAKGAHTPDCQPNKIKEQLEISMDRMNISKADIYIMHRDNLDVPVSEFVDSLNEIVDLGYTNVIGVSNWSLERFKKADQWAVNSNKHGLDILNNNLSLARMMKPLWAGCITANDPEVLKYLKESQKTHISWSSQARGYFLKQETIKENEKNLNDYDDSGPLRYFDCEENRTRRMRAQELAVKYEVEPHNIAAAWVLSQSFPSLAIIGPRKISETENSLKCLGINLTEEEISWLNLEIN
ncbi:MAG: aldo/keto reductase [Candidatus Puniceispirillales bacterium]|jgi:aryl-alcohol dehydrogenase-like predicted oxidoreductase|tara:strand:+ start:4726 stop:5664 length:939 start_codon:yes stop_codon:yes gene_type:complete